MTTITEKPIDLKLTKADLKERGGDGPMLAGSPTSDKNAPKYPWGLEIRLDRTSLDKLGMSDDLPEVGALCQINGIGRVVSVSKRETEGMSSCDVTIQIEKMNLAVADETEAAFAAGSAKGRGRGY